MGFFSDFFDFVGEIFEEVISWIIPIPEVPDFGDLQPDKNAQGVLLNKFQSNASIPIIYGTRKVGGNVVFLETSGADNAYLYMVLVLSEGEIDDITTIFINDSALKSLLPVSLKIKFLPSTLIFLV